VAYKLGTKVCLLTEGNDEVVKMLKQNVADTKAKEQQDDQRVLAAEKHLWGHELEAFEQAFPYKYDVIIGSDIMYGALLLTSPLSAFGLTRRSLIRFFDDALEDLMATLDRFLLRQDESVILLAYSYIDSSSPVAHSPPAY